MKRKLVSVSPWILAAACTLLTVIIMAFAINNYSREKQLMTEALLQKGLHIMRSLDTGLKVSIRANIESGAGGRINLVEHVQAVIDQLHDQEELHFVRVLDSEGKILAGTDHKLVGTIISGELLDFINQRLPKKEPLYRMYRNPSDNHQAFQLTKRYRPNLRGLMIRPPNRGGSRGDWMMGGRPEFQRLNEGLELLKRQKLVLLMQLDIEQFNQAVTRQLWQIVILSIVLLLVGIGGWLSLLTLQGFKGTQIRLQTIRAFNDILVQSLPVGLIATNENNSIQVVNDAAEQLLKSPIDQLIDGQPDAVLPPVIAELFNSYGSEEGQPVTMEKTLDEQSETPQSLLLTMMPVVDEAGKHNGSLLLLQDVSTVRRLESELRRNERLAALGRMAAGVAHELRNPLSSIKGLALLLQSKVADDPEGKETSGVLVQEVDRLNRSISELLDYARPEQLHKKQVSVNQLLEKAVNLVLADASSLNISSTLALAASPDQVQVDEDRMIQVFLNLLLNSIQAMEEGGVLEVATVCTDTEVVCTVSDSGVGIVKENISKVFDPYFTTKNDGTGLGLAITAKIVEDHGGSISLDSKVGEGTTVTVKLALFTDNKEDEVRT